MNSIRRLKKLQEEIRELEKDISGDPHARPDADGYTPEKAKGALLAKKRERLSGCIMSRDVLLGRATGGEDQYEDE